MLKQNEDERTDVVNAEMISPKVKTPSFHRRQSSIVESFIEDTEHVVLEPEDGD